MTDTTGLTDPIAMAKKELSDRRSPLIIRRHVGDVIVDQRRTSYYEEWQPNEMGHIH
jgi:hypothetical protein